MPFVELSNLSAKELLPGIKAEFLQTENLTIGFSDMKAGSIVPLHHHPEEAIDIVLEGRLEMNIGEEKRKISRGMITLVPSNVPHQATAITDCKVVTIFYPRRQRS